MSSYAIKETVLPKCDASAPYHGKAYCGDTCTCGAMETKRYFALTTVKTQMEAVAKRWGYEFLTEIYDEVKENEI